MSSIQRLNRGPQLHRAEEPQESLSPAVLRQQERPPVEPAARIPKQFQQDEFDTAQKRFQDEFSTQGKRPPVELNALEKLLTSADFQERLKETLAGTSPRAQQVKQVESTFKAFWKDSQDFAVRQGSGPSLSVPEPPRYEAPAETAWKSRVLTVPDFKLPDSMRVEQTAQASAALQESKRVAAAQQPFSLLGRVALRG